MAVYGLVAAGRGSALCLTDATRFVSHDLEVSVMWLAFGLMALAVVAYKCEAAGPAVFWAIVLWIVHVELPSPMADLTAVVAMFATAAIGVFFLADLLTPASAGPGVSTDDLAASMDAVEAFFEDMDDDP